MPTGFLPSRLATGRAAESEAFTVGINGKVIDPNDVSGGDPILDSWHCSRVRLLLRA
jgi:hypothetical protein